MLQIRMRHRHLRGPGVGRRRRAPMPVGRLLRGCRRFRRRGAVLARIHHRAGLLRAAPGGQDGYQRVQRSLDLVAIRLAQRRLPRLVQQLVQFAEVDVDASPLHRLAAPNNSRNRRCKGSASTCLRERFGRWLRSALPRPVVSPSTFQFAAR